MKDQKAKDYPQFFITIFTLLIILVSLTDCSKEEDPFLEIKKTNIAYLSPDAITDTLDIRTDTDWVITSSQDWITISPSSGNGDERVILTIKANLTKLERELKLEISNLNGTINRNVVVKQSAGVLDVDKLDFAFENPYVLSETFQVTSNTSWSLSSEQEWLSFSPVTGNGSSEVTVKVKPNVNLSIREAKFTIANLALDLKREVEIIQNPRTIIVAGGNALGGSALNELNAPSSVCVDDESNVFITDQLNSRVLKWEPGSNEGIVVAGGNGKGASLDQLDNPYGIFKTQDGALIIGDNQNHRIVKWIPGESEGVVVAGGNDNGSALNQLSSPCGVAVDANNTLFIAEVGNNRITKWEPGSSTGEIVASGSEIFFPFGMCLDKDANLYVASGGNCTITKWAPGASEGIVVAGGNGRGEGFNQLNDPSGVFVDDNGDIYISDQGNNRIMKWTKDAIEGIIVAGENGRGKSIDQLNSPSGLYVDSEGNIYVSDQGNNRIVKWLK